MRILLSSYSCGAGRGSEPGVGWNVARGLVKRGHEVTIVASEIYEDLNRSAIERESLPIKLITKSFGDSTDSIGEGYYQWQQKIGDIIREETAANHYDIVHHITWNQYRGLYDVFYTDLPFMIGPIGGAEKIPPYLLLHGKLPLRMLLKEVIRYMACDAISLIRRVNRSAAAHAVLASNPATAERLNKGLFHLSEPATVHPIIGVHEEDILPDEPQRTTPYFLFDGGISRPQKGTWLMLDALAVLWCNGCRVPVRMVGTQEEDKERIYRYLEKQRVPREAVELLPPVPHDEMLNLMRHSFALLSTVFRDSGGMAILEAVAQGTNVICFDIPSQKWLPDCFAYKVAVPGLFCSADTAARSLAETMQRVAGNASHGTAWHEQRCRFLRSEMTWAGHLNHIEEMYRKVVEK